MSILDKKINELASALSVCEKDKRDFKWELDFNHLYQLVKPFYREFYSAYKIHKNLRMTNFDSADYESAYSIAIYDSIKGYDISKGSFVGRVCHFAYIRFRAVTAYNFAKKRYSLDRVDVADWSKVNTVDKEDHADLLKMNIILDEFIFTDKYGKVIDILIHNEGKGRSSALKDYLGSYGARERKIVQRTKERLLKKLKEEGIYVFNNC